MSFEVKIKAQFLFNIYFLNATVAATESKVNPTLRLMTPGRKQMLSR